MLPKYIKLVKGQPNNGLALTPYMDGDKWVVTCYCGSQMIPVLLPYPEYLRDCGMNNCDNCAVDRFHGKRGAFYSCSRDGCEGLHSANKTNGWVGSPMGMPSSNECQILRHYAHIEFDHIWQGSNINRGKAYCLLARLLGLDMADTHISKFGISQCKLVIWNVREWKHNKGWPLKLPSVIN